MGVMNKLFTVQTCTTQEYIFYKHKYTSNVIRNYVTIKKKKNITPCQLCEKIQIVATVILTAYTFVRHIVGVYVDFSHPCTWSSKQKDPSTHEVIHQLSNHDRGKTNKKRGLT